MNSKDLVASIGLKERTSKKRSLDQEIDGSGVLFRCLVEFLSKRKRPVQPVKEEFATTSWQKKRESILKTLNTLSGTPIIRVTRQIKEDKKPEKIEFNRETLEMNLQLMKGELPRIYSDLLKRFSMADLFLESNFPRLTRITDLDHYLVMSQCKMNFLERHVEHIVYFYGLHESEEPKIHPYILGRTKPRMVTEKSILLMKLPNSDASTSTSTSSSTTDSSNTSFQGSARNLNEVFEDMKSKRKPRHDLKERKEQLKNHLNEYIEEKYSEYLEKTGTKRPSSGRASSFTMSELGEMPAGEIPPPIIFHQKTARESLAEFKKDVDKAVSEHKLSPLSPIKSKKFNTHLDIDLDSL